MFKKCDRRTFFKTGAAVTGLQAVKAWSGVQTAASDEILTPFMLKIHCSGGWDPTMVFDPKIDLAGFAQEAGSILAFGAKDLLFVDHADRPAVSTFFAKEGGRTLTLNGLYCGSLRSEDAIKYTFGAMPPGFTQPTDWLSYYAYAQNSALTLPHAVISAPYLPGQLEHLAIKIDARYLSHIGQNVPATTPLGSVGEEALYAYRLAQFTKLTAKPVKKSLDADKLNAVNSGFLRAAPVESALGEVLVKVGEQGSDSDLTYAGKLALELFASGHSLCATIQAGPTNAWCSESDHFATQSPLFEQLFTGINQIIATAEAKGLRDRLIILVTSERGRAPLLNTRNGKDSWAYTSALLWGTIFMGGKTVGQTDEFFRGKKLNPLFGETTGRADVPLEMAHVMNAIYLKTGVRANLFFKKFEPLAPILAA